MSDRTFLRQTTSWRARILFRTCVTGVFLAIFAGVLYLPRLYELVASNSDVLNLYTFPELIDLEMLKNFEQESGIKVNVKFYDNNEEMLAKFRINKGEGYDLVTPSDYMVELMHRENLLQSLDPYKLTNFRKLDKRLMNRFFDPGNLYSVPLAWSIYGLGYSTKWFGERLPEDSWSMVFDPPFLRKPEGVVDSKDPRYWPYKICIFNDVREMVFAASLYLWGRVDQFSAENVAVIKEILVRQKEWVESYTGDNLKYFLWSTIVPLVVTDSGLMKQVMDETDQFNFVLPREGTFMSIENVAIPISSKKREAAHKLIDFLLSTAVQHKSFDEYGYTPVNTEAQETVDPKYRNNPSFFPSDADFSRLHILHNRISLKKLMNLWIYIKCV